jgi:hypothetical protein
MKNQKQRFVPLKEKFDQFVQALPEIVQALPESERVKLKEPLKKVKLAAKTATQVLFWSKLAPEVEKDSPFFAKWASQDLKAHKLIILRAAERSDTRFFIDLGKCLSGEMDSTLYDELDEHVALILACDLSISARDAVRYLRELGWSISEDAFRMRKQRLKQALAEFDLALGTRKPRLKRKLRQSR